MNAFQMNISVSAPQNDGPREDLQQEDEVAGKLQGCTPSPVESALLRDTAPALPIQDNHHVGISIPPETELAGDYQPPWGDAEQSPAFANPHDELAHRTEDFPYQLDPHSWAHLPEPREFQQHLAVLDTFNWNNFRASRMDWLGCETEWSDRQSLPSEVLSISDVTRSTEETMSSKPNMTTGAVQNSEGEFRAVLPGILDRGGKQIKETWPGVLDRGGNEAWPFDYTSNKGFRKIKLPPLRQILEQTVGNRPAIEKTTLMDLIKILSAPQIPSLNDSPALEALPAVAFLSQFVKIFFAEFHSVQPIIHVPTWRIEKCPTALLAAMACIGATYSTAPCSEEVAALLAEITQRALFWMVIHHFSLS